MNTTYSKVAGLDVHHKTIVCAVRCPSPSGKALSQTRSFGTMTKELRALADYLESFGVTHVALESTGVLWKLVWNILEGRFTLCLVNPRHLKKVPGRKTDVSDAEWIAQLLQHGLLKGSFVPPRAIRDLRDLTRQTPSDSSVTWSSAWKPWDSTSRSNLTPTTLPKASFATPILTPSESTPPSKPRSYPASMIQHYTRIFGAGFSGCTGCVGQAGEESRMQESYEVRPSQPPRPRVMRLVEQSANRSVHRGTTGPCTELRKLLVCGADLVL